MVPGPELDISNSGSNNMYLLCTVKGFVCLFRNIWIVFISHNNRTSLAHVMGETSTINAKFGIPILQFPKTSFKAVIIG